MCDLCVAGSVRRWIPKRTAALVLEDQTRIRLPSLDRIRVTNSEFRTPRSRLRAFCRIDARRISQTHAVSQAGSHARAPDPTHARRIPRQVLSERGDASEQLAMCTATPARSMDLTSMRSAIDAARDAGVPADAISRAEAQLADVASRRTAAESDLALEVAKPWSILDPAALKDAIEVAREVGVAAAVISDAERQVQEVLAARGSAESQLESTATPPPSTLDLDALAASLEIARASGVDPRLVERAQGKLDAVRQLE